MRFNAIGVLAPFTFAGLDGSLHDIAAWLALPAGVTWGVAIASGIGFLVVMWEAGRRIQPPVGALIVPFVAGTVGYLVVLLPAPAPIVINLAGGSAYWIVAIAGSLWELRAAGRSRTEPLPPVRLAFSAMMLSVLLTLVVRLMATGIRFAS